ncbi:hypothetical protein FOXYS1_909 [Fusarium oxysporum]|uniref:Metallo-beta-lactamase domain-containing protein n=1 Tax=Fusarium oxysporum TaxID=5507 RepID=A0A8H5APX1_FUSOX|nr:hypothetical protein FOXYS1_909 [Fusarium oxysporum]
MAATIEWFGTTTYRLKANGLVIWLDTWLERPSVLPKYLDINDVEEADYIFISHAHFDHLPGADRIARKTGAIVIANGEAFNLLRDANVPEEQLMPVAGGERIPLFLKADRDRASAGAIEVAPGLPGAPPQPHDRFAALVVHVWPSLHCFMPGTPGHPPEIIDTRTEYTGEASPYTCTVDITKGMKYGLLRLGDLVPEELRDLGIRSMIDYLNDREKHLFSHFDGGQLAFNFLIGPGKTLFWSAHMGAYEGVLRRMEPKPDVAILALAGRANLDGRPYDGSAADFITKKINWLGQPKTVIWCLHDESPVRPRRVDTTGADEVLGTGHGSENSHCRLENHVEQEHAPHAVFPSNDVMEQILALDISGWRTHASQTSSTSISGSAHSEDVSMTLCLGMSSTISEIQHIPQTEPNADPSEETVTATSPESTLGAGILADIPPDPLDLINSVWQKEDTTGWADLQATECLRTGSPLEPPEPIQVETIFEGMGGSRATFNLLATDWLSSTGPSDPLGQSGYGPWSTADLESLDVDLEDFSHVERLSTEGYQNLDLWAYMMSTINETGTFRSSEPSILPPLKTLNAYIQLYFEKFHDTLPIIHRPTFDPSSAPCLLVLAIANIGRRFSRLTYGLSNELGLENLIESSEISDTVPLWLAQAILLCQIAMSFTNDRPAVERSLSSRGVLDVVLKKLEPSLRAAASSMCEEEALDDQVLWKAWVHCEALRRTAYGLWLVDSQCLLLFDLAPAVPTESLQIPLPCHERLWERSSAISWKSQWTKTKELNSLRVQMQSLYSLNPISADVGAFSFLIILFGYFRDRLFLKQVEDMGLVGLVNMHGERITYRMERMPELWILLDPTRRPESNSTNAVTVQYYHIIGVVVHVPLKDLTAFSGWRVSRLKQQETRRKLMTWVSSHGDSAREAALHAGTLFRLCWCHSTSGYQEPSAILIAALALWVYNSSLAGCKSAGREAYGEKQTPPTFRLGNEIDEDEVLDWVHEGKQARPFVVGVGNINAPGGYWKVVNQAITFLASLKEWPISQVFSSDLKDLLLIFDKDSP